MVLYKPHVVDLSRKRHAALLAPTSIPPDRHDLIAGIDELVDLDLEVATDVKVALKGSCGRVATPMHVRVR